MRATKESVIVAKYINTFLNDYMPSQKTKSEYTMKSYDEALSLYIGFLGFLEIRTLYLLPKTVAYLQAYLAGAHGENPLPDSYVFYSRNKGPSGQMCQNAINKQLKKHALTASAICKEVPRDIHAHQLRHAKASHWLEDGMNVVQISFLLGHAQLQTTMIYLDITTEQEAKALATLEDESNKSVPKKWKASGKSLAAMCGVRQLKS